MDKNWAIHGEFVVILITLIGGFYLLDGKIERQVERTDRLFESSCQRTDKLYEMYVETQKELKNIYMTRKD
jgi:hypothetical protein